MIERGQHHVLYDDVELMQRIRSPQTLQVLKQLQEYYETRERRKLMTEQGCELNGIKEAEKEALLELLKSTKIWLRNPRYATKPQL
jgi:hypothetical protein